ncbi:hypothetical protein BJV77DRAFT_777104 [Russula vinacea]|nr:hypothetical protein BJV77DRAFT_777104 [Russula vinacea]
MSTPVCQNQTITANTDVLGKGIRINFYYTMILLAIIPRTPNTEELLNSLYTNAGISGFGLLLTAIIQTALNQLSLFHAIFILHILFFLGTGVSPMGKYHWTTSRVVMGVVIQFLSVVSFTAWGLYMWVNVKDIGSDPGCNVNDKIKYVIFFATIRATEPWLKNLWIATLVLSAVGLMLSFGAKAVVLFAMRRMEQEERAEEMNSTARRVTPAESPETRPEGETEESEKQWYINVSFPLLFSAIYSTIMLELTIARNRANIQSDGTTTRNTGPGVVQIDDAWEFGQVLSIVMIFVNINEIIHFLFGYFGRRKLRLARERQARTEATAHQAEGQSSSFLYRSRGPSGSDVSTRDQAPDKITSGYELQNLDKRNVEVSETIVASALESPQHQHTSTLR